LRCWRREPPREKNPRSPRQGLSIPNPVRLESPTYLDRVRLESLTYANPVRLESLT
jgi:hypothetical protein